MNRSSNQAVKCKNRMILCADLISDYKPAPLPFHSETDRFRLKKMHGFVKNKNLDLRLMLIKS